MIVKSGLEKIFLKFIHAGDYFSLLHKSVQNHKFSNKNNHLPTWKDFKINFSRPLFNIIFRPKIVMLDPDSNLRVKTMYESVKFWICNLKFKSWTDSTPFATSLSLFSVTPKIGSLCSTNWKDTGDIDHDKLSTQCHWEKNIRQRTKPSKQWRLVSLNCWNLSMWIQ